MDLKANLTKAQTTVKTSDMKLKHNAEALKKAKAEMKKVSFFASFYMRSQLSCKKLSRILNMSTFIKKSNIIVIPKVVSRIKIFFGFNLLIHGAI